MWYLARAVSTTDQLSVSRVSTPMFTIRMVGRLSPDGPATVRASHDLAFLPAGLGMRTAIADRAGDLERAGRYRHRRARFLENGGP